MATRATNVFPLYFTLERVDNGYILTAKEETGGLAEGTFRKEVVVDDKIKARIGQLLQLDSMVKEHPVVFRVEAVGEGTYKRENNMPPGNLMEAKLAFVHFHAKGLEPNTILSLLIEDAQIIEIYGLEAEKVAKNNDLSLSKVGGIPVLRFPNNKEGKKALASYVPRTTLMKITQKEVAEWYENHKI